ncbi:MAG: homoserine O-succinyltransferase [Gammaproteobacteria bacterium]|nr:homoserine O-succinyltransferase [Gammaproteobacteria bacterium]
MPLIQDRALPTFDRLRAEGQQVIRVERAHHQDIRELHIGLYNMMPDTALQATERQFYRLIGASNQVVQLHIHPFAPKKMPRGKDAQAHIDAFYTSIEDIHRDGLDGLIISGANPVQDDLTKEPFWPELCELFEWSYANVTSTLCSCLSSHAHFLYKHGIKRSKLPQKCWGVYEHRVSEDLHPLTRGINTQFKAAHSRWNETKASAMADAGLPVLVNSEDVGFFLATSADGIRYVYLQGHPEYDTQSLLKEYKREIQRWADGLQAEPPFVENYFTAQAQAILREYVAKMGSMPASALKANFPETLLSSTLENTWRDTSRALINNWIGTLYQLTHVERAKPFMDGVDPENPLESLKSLG